MRLWPLRQRPRIAQKWLPYWLDFDHVELGLRRAAKRASPLRRDIRPARAGLESFFGRALGLVVEVAASAALPGLVVVAHFLSGTSARFSIARMLARMGATSIAGSTRRCMFTPSSRLPIVSAMASQ